jgi:regulator of nucleoside diphosphate kinase
MAQAHTTRGARKPPIHLSEADYDVIADLALAMQKRAPDLAQLILDEINRAKVHSPGSVPKDVVTLGSEVAFQDDSTGEERRLQLVLPQDADIAADRISVMTPVGAGLIGMSVGREISWPTPDGRPRVLRILEVKQQP